MQDAPTSYDYRPLLALDRKAADEAAQTVTRLLGAKSETVQLRAAVGVLQLLGELEMTDLAARLAVLEREIAGAS